MDLATLGGLGLGGVMIIFGIISGGGDIGNFIDMPSLVITFGGAIAATLACYKIPIIMGTIGTLNAALKEPPQTDPSVVIKSILDMANVARKEGLLALEESAHSIEDEFLKKGIMLVVDGTDAELVRAILETDMDATESRHKTFVGVWDKIGEMGPAWGMIGTLIGLIIMLQNMDDPSSIGPAMAVALLTTMYGSMLANWIAGPISAKLQLNNSLEMTVKTVTVEGLLSIQAGENPRVIEEKLKTFLPPNARDGIGSEAGGGE